MDLSKNSKYIHLVIMFALTFGIANCPPFGQITPYGMKALGVFVGVLYGWIAFDLFWTSLFGFIALGILDVTGIVAAFQTGIGDQMLIQVLMVMAFAVGLEEMGVTDAVANWMLTKNIFRKSPWFLIIGIIAVSYVLGAMGAGLAVVFLMWSIIEKISDLGGYEKQNPLKSFLILMIPVAAFGGSFIFPFQGGTIIYLSYLYQVTDKTIPMGDFVIYGFITTVLIIVLLLLVAKFILRLDVSKFVMPDEVVEELKTQKVTLKQKTGLCIAVGFIAALLLPAFFSFPGSAFLSKLGMAGCSVVALLIGALVKVDGKGIINLNKVFARVNWQLVLLLAVTYPIAGAIRSEEAGIMPTIMAYVLPAVQGMGLTTFIIVCMVLLGLITQVTHNIVLAAMFMPFLLPIAQGIGGDTAMFTMWFVLFLTLNCAYCTPAASFNSALVFGNANMTRKDAYIDGVIVLVVNFVVLALIGIPLGGMIFK